MRLVITGVANSTLGVLPKSEPIATSSHLIGTVATLNERISAGTRRILLRDDFRVLGEQYQAALNRRVVNMGFNVFAMVSDLYYRENFHSDVLRALLDPGSKHRDGGKFLRLFFEFLRTHGTVIKMEDYANASVVREEGRIDILIADHTSKRAIIIENKINGAKDMHRQIPGYFAYTVAQGFAVDAIVYLRLERQQHPDKTDWTRVERKAIEPKLICISAFQDSSNDLLNGWLRPCQDSAEDSDARHIFKHYGEILLKLGSNVMNKPIMREFHALMSTGDNYRDAQSLRAMLDELVLFRVENIIDTFKGDLGPYDSVKNWKDRDAYFEGCFWHEAHLGIDVGVEPDYYQFSFWDRHDDEGKKGMARRALKEMGIVSDYTASQGQFTKKFSFPAEEQAMFEHVRWFKGKLGELLATAALSEQKS